MNRPRVAGRRRRRDAADALRSDRVQRVLEVVEQFVYDLGLLVAGHDVDLSPYVAPGAAERLHEAVQPALRSGTVTRPDFGEYAQLRIDGDLLDLAAPVQTMVEFDDRSSLLDDQGAAVSRPRRHVILKLILDPAITRVLDHHIEIAV